MLFAESTNPQLENTIHKAIRTIDKILKAFFVKSFIDLNFMLNKVTQVNTRAPRIIKIKLIVVNTFVKSYPLYR